jgi:hypothetical protein
MADARRAISAPDGPEHHIPHIAPRQMRVQPSIKTPLGPANEQKNDYISVQSLYQTAPETRSAYKASAVRKPYPSVPLFTAQITLAPHNLYFDLFPRLIPNKRLDLTKAAIMIKFWNKDKRYMEMRTIY